MVADYAAIRTKKDGQFRTVNSHDSRNIAVSQNASMSAKVLLTTVVPLARKAHHTRAKEFHDDRESIRSIPSVSGN
jgi:hypothetical protein